MVSDSLSDNIELTITPTHTKGMYEMTHSSHETAVYYSKSLLNKGFVLFDNRQIDREIPGLVSELELLKYTSKDDTQFIDTYLLEIKYEGMYSKIYIDFILEKLDKTLNINNDVEINRILNYLSEEHDHLIAKKDKSFDYYFNHTFAWLKNDVFNIYPDYEVVYNLKD